jgi:hypothetical protein
MCVVVNFREYFIMQHFAGTACRRHGAAAQREDLIEGRIEQLQIMCHYERSDLPLVAQAAEVSDQSGAMFEIKRG